MFKRQFVCARISCILKVKDIALIFSWFLSLKQLGLYVGGNLAHGQLNIK